MCGVICFYGEAFNLSEMLLGIENLPVFIIAALIFNLTPGQDTIYIIGRSVAQGKKAGIISVLGISSGSLIHTLAAAFGLSAILATSAQAFQIVKYAGAIYLIYLGLRLILEKHTIRRKKNQKTVSQKFTRIYRQAVLTNLLNPKVAVFFLAFLPQFIKTDSPHKLLSFIFLGGLFIFTGTLWCLIVAIFSAKFSEMFRIKPRALIVNRKITGLVFILLGLNLARSELKVP